MVNKRENGFNLTHEGMQIDTIFSNHTENKIEVWKYPRLARVKGNGLSGILNKKVREQGLFEGKLVNIYQSLPPRGLFLTATVTDIHPDTCTKTWFVMAKDGCMDFWSSLSLTHTQTHTHTSSKVSLRCWVAGSGLSEDNAVSTSFVTWMERAPKAPELFLWHL